MAWKIEFDGAAKKALKKLDRQAARRILDYLDEVATPKDPRQRGKGTTANLSGLWRYRVGNYRVVCVLEEGRLTVLVLGMGHRSRVHE